MGGSGYMRVLEIGQDGRVTVYSYSPVVNDYLFDFDHYYSFFLD
jgi:hypothetical protein